MNGRIKRNKVNKTHSYPTLLPDYKNDMHCFLVFQQLKLKLPSQCFVIASSKVTNSQNSHAMYLSTFIMKSYEAIDDYLAYNTVNQYCLFHSTSDTKSNSTPSRI